MEASKLVTVVIADDHPVYRDGLARAIAAWPELTVVGEAPDGKAAAALIDTLAPDVAVLDAHMPGIDGITVCAWVTTRRGESSTRVLLLSVSRRPAGGSSC